MSLITACPACSTNFFVTSEQLNAHHGDVRCGKCSHVFNALDRLGEVGEAPLPEISQQTVPKPTVVPTPVSATPITPAVETPSIFGEVASRTKTMPTGRRKHKVVWPYYAFATGLLLIASLQMFYFLRTPIATHWPGTKPFLSEFCSLLGCTVELPRDIGLLVIDDSDLQEDAEHQGVIHLSTVLINNAPFAQAYPLLELTLTDRNDRPVLRRAFNPSEYLHKGADIETGIPAGEELQVKLALTSSDVDVFGYRVFVTYP
jgi:predicted Zn finger-like uncharacterized protein